MRNLVKIVSLGALAVAAIAQPAYARDRDGDHRRDNGRHEWRNNDRHDRHRGHVRYVQPRHYVSYYNYPAPYYYYPQPVYYAPPFSSLSFGFRF